MADFPKAVDFPLPIITTGSDESIGIEINSAGTLFTTSSAWPLANLALYIPFRIGAPIIVTQMFWINTATVGTNHVDVGIYDAQGNRIVSMGSTLTAGATAIQVADITDTLLQAGLYYMAMSMDGTTDTLDVNTAPIPTHRAAGVYEQTSAFTLPATATFVGSTRAFVPLMGILTGTVI